MGQEIIAPSAEGEGLHRRLMRLRLRMPRVWSIYTWAGKHVTNVGQAFLRSINREHVVQQQAAPAGPPQRTQPVIDEAAASIAIASPRNELASIASWVISRESIRLHSLLVAVPKPGYWQ